MYDAEAMERDKIAIQRWQQLFLSCLGFMAVLDSLMLTGLSLM
jgi:hypothetical protein